MTTLRKALCGIVVLLTLFAVEEASADSSKSLSAGAVYTMTNAKNNEVLAYTRKGGKLTLISPFTTGGDGSGAPLNSQDSVVLTDEGFVLAVNAGSDSISVLQVKDKKLGPPSKTPSGGSMPISITECHGVVYVLNRGGGGTIAGFSLKRGMLTLRSVQSLPSNSTDGLVQIGFSPDCDSLVVTDRGANTIPWGIFIYEVGKDGVAAGPSVVTAPAGFGSSGFGFKKDRKDTVLVVAGDGDDVGSYDVDNDGDSLTLSSLKCPKKEIGTAFTTNFSDGTISSYGIGHDGALCPKAKKAASLSPGITAMAVSGDDDNGDDNKWLFVLNPNTGKIYTLSIKKGELSSPSIEPQDLPLGAEGLAAK